jgi:hypothetical protein
MYCPYCNAELILHDYYMSGYPNCTKLGDIYKCPNYEGFEFEIDREKYADHSNQELTPELCCGSAVFNGFFHTNIYDNLKEGHPC